MPFDFDTYAQEVTCMTEKQLAHDKHRYTRSVWCAGSGVSISAASSIHTVGVSLAGVPIGIASGGNAYEKLKIINAEMERRQIRSKNHTRVRDMVLGCSLAGATAVFGLGFASGTENILEGMGEMLLESSQELLQFGAEQAAGGALEHHERKKHDW